MCMSRIVGWQASIELADSTIFHSANWKLPPRWNDVPFAKCPGCGWRGEFRASTFVDIEATSRCPSSGCERLQAASRRVFCATLADCLDNEKSIDWLMDMTDLMRRTPKLDWLMLTKHIGILMPRLRAAAKLARDLSVGLDDPLAAWINDWHNGTPPSNVWVGASVVNQA